MRIILLLVLAGGAGWADDAIGVWKMNPRRSTFAAVPAPRNFTLRIERHATPGVFTVERTEQDGRSSSDSTILFLDGKPRGYQDLECSGANLRSGSTPGPSRSFANAKTVSGRGSSGAPRA